MGTRDRSDTHLRCWRCEEPVFVERDASFLGWHLRHRDWESDISERAIRANWHEAPSYFARTWLEDNHRNAALKLCGEVIELFRAYSDG